MKPIMQGDHGARPAIDTINFEAVNQVPSLEGLTVCSAPLVPGMENVWYEFVPECYDGAKAVPLIVQVHGGGQDGMRWAQQTVWHELAKTENFIVIYPNSPSYGMWNCEDRDINYLYDLIHLICGKYNIDRSRIYMQGMSNGDMMTLAFTLKHPEVLAAAGYTSGPSAPEALGDDRPVGALPIIQERGEFDIAWKLTPETVDIYHNRYTMNDANRELWYDVNGTDGIPALTIEGKDNFLTFPGENAPIINWEIVSMGHREPVYSAQVYWDRLYSGCRRVDGEIVVGEAARYPTGDEDTVVVALGSPYAFRKNELIPMREGVLPMTRMLTPAPVPRFCPVYLGEMSETEVLCVPVEFFSSVMGAELTQSADGMQASLTFPGKTVEISSHSLLMKVNGSFRALQKPCMRLGNTLYVPAAEFCQQILGKTVSFADDVLAISDHYIELGRYTARVLRSLMGSTMRPRKRS